MSSTAPPGDGTGPVVGSSLSGGERRALASLLDAVEAADGYASLSDRARLALDAETDPERVVVTWRAPGAGELAGVAFVDRPGDAWVLEYAVRPQDWHGRVPAALVAAAVDAAARRGGGPFTAWHRVHDDDGGRAMAEAGLDPVRVLVQLRAPLPVAAGDHEPVEVRPFHPGRDEEAWLEVNARAFAGHPEQGTWTLDDLVRREREPWFDPGGFLLHEVDGRLAAFCWTKVHRESLLGEIYVIGVDPDFQGRGLGRALTLAGLAHLAVRGLPTAMLYVEETNTAALALYRSLGFTEHHREVLYAGEVAPQVAAPTA